ncbi:MAG: hypothetical protein WDZ94_05455 [Patescibacteria group bacterium]
MTQRQLLIIFGLICSVAIAIYWLLNSNVLSEYFNYLPFLDEKKVNNSASKIPTGRGVFIPKKNHQSNNFKHDDEELEKETSVEESINYVDYTELSSNIERINEEFSLYTHLAGQPNRAKYYQNYTVKYPNSWKILTHTNNPDLDTYGTNVLFEKEGNYILIRQQLFETTTCYFDADRQKMGMSVWCNYVASIPNAEREWKIYTIDQSGVSRVGSWIQYGICDQNSYAEAISSYGDEPTAEEKQLCSPWTPVGEIDLYMPVFDQEIFNEFTEIVSSISVVN